MRTQMACIGGYIVVYKSYKLGQNTVIESAALWLVAITATMFIVCSVMGGIALMIFGAIKWIGG